MKVQDEFDIVRALTDGVPTYAGEWPATAVERAVASGRVKRVYYGVMGFMGCAKLELVK